MKHLECDYVSDWHKKLSEIGVPYKMEPLEVIGRKEIETKAAAAAAVSADQFSNKRVYMHTKVYLAPSMADDFEDAWEKVRRRLQM